MTTDDFQRAQELKLLNKLIDTGKYLNEIKKFLKF